MNAVCGRCGEVTPLGPMFDVTTVCGECGNPLMGECERRAGMMKKEWVNGAKRVKIVIGEGDDAQVIKLDPRAFSTGSVGYGFSGKLEIGEDRVQGSVNLVVIGSKEWEAEPKAETAKKGK